VNPNKQRALVFTILLIVYTLFDYFFLRGHGDEAVPDAPPAQVQPAPLTEKP
jgi:hypothetical protein